LQRVAYQLNALGISVLALLRDRPMHGYEMFQTLIARHEDRIVKVRPGSLYHVVYRLAEEKLIRPSRINRNGNRPERTTFEITEAGAGALTERVADLVANPVNEFPRFVVALSELHNLDLETALSALGARVSALDDTVAELTALRRASIAPDVYLIALNYLLATTQAQLNWLRGLIDSLRSGQLQWPCAARPDAIVGSRSEVGI
jgi:DNA-binding PadR family transcriptional regulator